MESHISIEIETGISQLKALLSNIRVVPGGDTAHRTAAGRYLIRTGDVLVLAANYLQYAGLSGVIAALADIADFFFEMQQRQTIQLLADDG